MSLPLYLSRAALAAISLFALVNFIPAQLTDHVPASVIADIHTTTASNIEFLSTLKSIDDPSLSLAIGTCEVPSIGAIEVEASAGIPGPTGYASLSGAFTALNTGIHQGAITIDVCGDTIETVSASLDASGGSAAYTAVTIRPVGGTRIIEGSIAGAVIKLNGADNVLIDGRQNGTGSSRDLTIRNNSSSAATAAIWLASTGIAAGATNNTIRNLEIAAGADQSTSGNATFGIFLGSSTGVIATNSGGDDLDNNSFIGNRIIKARYGIATRGQTANNAQNTVITDNIIGPSSFGSDQIGRAGIYLQADAGATVSRNTVQFVGCLEPQSCAAADRVGIAVGNENWNALSSTSTAVTSGSYTVTRNIVHDIVEENGLSSVGIGMTTTRGGAATNNLVANNFVYNVRSNGAGAAGDQPAAIAWAAGNADKIAFNSISMTGDMDPGAAAASSNFGNAIRVTSGNAANNANLTLKNNSIYLDAGSSSTPAARYYAISLPSASYSFGTGGIGNNNYYRNAANPQTQTVGEASASGNAATTSHATLTDWTSVFPADTGSIQADPLYLSSSSDLHLTVASPNVNAGASIAGIADDIDGDPRSGTFDIGADEFLAPTEAPVSLSGRVTDASGRGIRNAVIVLEGGGMIEPRITATGSMGFYQLDGLSTGSYNVTVIAKRHSFAVPTRAATLSENVIDFDFVADPQE